MITEITGNIRVQQPIPARGKLHGMTVRFLGDDTVWTVLDRHPDRGCWWLHRRDGDAWLTTYARYTELEQVITDDSPGTV